MFVGSNDGSFRICIYTCLLFTLSWFTATTLFRHWSFYLRPALIVEDSYLGFPGGKESACSAGDRGLIPGSGRSPGGRHGNSLQYSCLENPMDRAAWQATVHRVAKSQTCLSNSHTYTYTHTHTHIDSGQSPQLQAFFPLCAPIHTALLIFFFFFSLNFLI